MRDIPTNQAIDLGDPGHPFADEIRAYILANRRRGVIVYWGDAAAEIRAAKERAERTK